ncbi:DUF3619 family protein [Methyloversatilis sp.]|uniref:DUF3619 family protein n=1 Tax=Methyloversatilis sp. TaxID=2569862 RepID=UPI0035AE1D8D
MKSLSPHDPAQANVEAVIGQRAHAALEASCANLPADIAFRLRQSREGAVAIARPRRRLAWLPRLAGLPGHSGGNRVREILFPTTGIVLLALIAALASQQLQDERLNESVDIDGALLTDDLPIDAYLDRGFGAWLDSQGQR